MSGASSKAANLWKLSPCATRESIEGEEMSNMQRHAPHTGRPSLMGASSNTSASSVPDTGGSSEPLRVLADLGGQKTSSRLGATALALVCCVAVCAASGIYWASSHRDTAKAPAAEAATAAPPKEIAKASSPPSVPSIPAPEISPARVVVDEPSLVTAKPLAVAAADAAPSPLVAANAVVHRDITAAATPVPAKLGRKVAESAPRVAPSATAKAKPVTSQPAIAAAKTRNTAQRQARANPNVEAASSRTDPDTDLLAAMLRRNGDQKPAVFGAK